MHREKLDFDRDLAERKFTFDRELAERKFSLDRELADWKRRTELAEQVLADSYKARDLFNAARNPFAFAGEGSTRPGRDKEPEEKRSSKDAIYAPFERLSKNIDFFSEMHARRYRFMAIFGAASASPFVEFMKAYNEIASATRMLLSERPPLRNDIIEKLESTIGWGLEENDEIKIRLDKAVTDLESICRPVLSATAENTDS